MKTLPASPAGLHKKLLVASFLHVSLVKALVSVSVSLGRVRELCKSHFVSVLTGVTEGGHGSCSKLVLVSSIQSGVRLQMGWLF